MRLQPLIGPSSVLLSTSEPASRRFLRLPHPRSGQPALFLPFSGDGPTASPNFARADGGHGGADAGAEGLGGIMELQAVVGQSDAEKSWFVMRENAADQVISDGTVLLLTPVDPIFLLVSLLLSLSSIDPFAGPSAAGPGQTRFETTESLFDRAATSWTGDASAAEPVLAKDVEAFTSLPVLRHALPRICDALDSQQAGDDAEKLWRLSREKVLAEMGKKVDRIAQASGKAAEAAKAAGKNEGEVMATGLMLVKEELDDVGGVPNEVLRDARRKIALDIVAGYLPPSVAAALRQSQPLTHLSSHRGAISARLASLAATAHQPGRSSSSSSIQDEDLGGGKAAALKKAKAQAQKGSRGVEALKKASTRGMSKLGDMWGKAKEKAKEKAKDKVEAVVNAVADGEGQGKDAQTEEAERGEAGESAKAATGQDTIGMAAKERKRRRTTTEESTGKKVKAG